MGRKRQVHQSMAVVSYVHMVHITSPNNVCSNSHTQFTFIANVQLELGGMTKNLYHGIFLNYTGFTVYDGIYFFHA